MEYAIDRIEEDYVICENIQTKEKIELKKVQLPSEIHEGSILKKINNTYTLEPMKEQERRKQIQEKLNRIKNIEKKHQS